MELYPEFKAWPKIPRFTKESFVITEKIDGSNGCIVITPDGNIYAQSRSKFLKPTKADDNFGFCAWVLDNKEDLLKLGEGYHYGEWWGYGIQRGYGLADRRFSLFNQSWPEERLPSCVGRVPFLGCTIQDAMDILLNEGSRAAPGYMKPEGLVLRQKQISPFYKVIID